MKSTVMERNMETYRKIIRGVDEEEIFRGSDDCRDRESFMKELDERELTEAEMASELLSASVENAGLDEFPKTWKKLIRIADDISGAVYSASCDAYLGGTLEFLIDNCTEKQWKKLREDREEAVDATEEALGSIENDGELTVLPTLLLAEKVGTLDIALEYIDGLIEEYSDRTDYEYQDMVSYREEFGRKK